MPPKSMDRKKAAHKVEVAEKVREIKQRQQNWFKDREKHLSNKSPEDGSKSSGPPRAILRQTHTISRPSPSTPESTQYNVDQQDPHTSGKGKGFKSWLQNRQNTAEESPTEKSEDDDNSTIYDEGANDLLLSRKTQRSLSPEMFDTLADQIINKVKRQMKTEEKTKEETEVYRSHSRGRKMNGPKTVQGLQSHHCQICQQVMIAPAYTPMLLIPCGHTYCSPCLEGRAQCPGCQTEVQSATCNIMLQQIIQEYQEQQGHNPSPLTNTAKKQQKQKVRDYETEYSTLEMRCEVLASEIDNIEDRVRGIDDQIRKQERFTEQISYQEQMIDQEIEELRLKQRQLTAQRQEYSDERHEWEEKRREEEKQMEMTKNTIKSLQKEMQKIKRLMNDGAR